MEQSCSRRYAEPDWVTAACRRSSSSIRRCGGASCGDVVRCASSHRTGCHLRSSGLASVGLPCTCPRVCCPRMRRL